MKLTPTERRLLAILHLQGRATEQELATLTAARSIYAVRPALRVLVPAGLVQFTETPDHTKYMVMPVADQEEVA